METKTEENYVIRIQWENEQLELKTKMITENGFDWSLDLDDDTCPNKLSFIGGVDISFIKGNEVDACAALVILKWPSLEVVYEKCEMVQLTLPYISSFLAFREVTFLIKLLAQLKEEKPELYPQLLFTDGNGFLHPRGFGIACHLGVLVDLPTIGIGKTLFHVDGITKDKTKALFNSSCHEGGDFVNLVGDSGTIWGAAFKSTKDSANPIYISTGHRIDLNTSIQLSLQSCLYRIPEAVRQADLRSRDFIRKL
jgi:deoxyinosine 3'endonuclease (endonuclease V)